MLKYGKCFYIIKAAIIINDKKGEWKKKNKIFKA